MNRFCMVRYFIIAEFELTLAGGSHLGPVHHHCTGRLVPTIAAAAALARRRRSVCDLALRSDAAANPCCDGDSLLESIHEKVPRSSSTGRSPSR